jgi:hypothetical protein
MSELLSMRICSGDWRRLAAATVLALLVCAHAHEAVPIVLFGHVLDRTQEHRESAPPGPESPKSSCALCVLVATAALASPVQTVVLPVSRVERAHSVLDERFVAVDAPWSPVSRRGPPALTSWWFMLRVTGRV